MLMRIVPAEHRSDGILMPILVPIWISWAPDMENIKFSILMQKAAAEPTVLHHFLTFLWLTS
jgi:hypothetical protein